MMRSAIFPHEIHFSMQFQLNSIGFLAEMIYSIICMINPKLVQIYSKLRQGVAKYVVGNYFHFLSAM